MPTQAKRQSFTRRSAASLASGICATGTGKPLGLVKVATILFGFWLPIFDLSFRFFGFWLPIFDERFRFYNLAAGHLLSEHSLPLDSVIIPQCSSQTKPHVCLNFVFLRTLSIFIHEAQ